MLGHRCHSERSSRLAIESITVADAWNDYYSEKSAAKKDGKLVWGDKHREHLKRHRMVEMGNDVPLKHKPIEIANPEHRKRQIAEQVYSKLRYK